MGVSVYGHLLICNNACRMTALYINIAAGIRVLRQLIKGIVCGTIPPVKNQKGRYKI